MIREILEKNGFNFTEYDDYFHNTIYIHKNNIDIDNYYNNSIEDYEFASRCYVKENGFKLSWLIKESGLNTLKFTNYVSGIILYGYEDGEGIEILKVDNNYIIETLFNEVQEYFGNFKLLCWLYANDIKIINDLIEETKC